jgi:hypothetical protein
MASTLLNFIATYVGDDAFSPLLCLKPHLQVLHRQLLSFHASLKVAESLDDMISLHNLQ